MGNANKPNSQIYAPDYFRSKTIANESNYLCALPKEILYYCVPLSQDLKFAGGKQLNWRESKQAKQFTKKDFQLGTLERIEEIVGDGPNATRHITDAFKKDESSSESEETDEVAEDPTLMLPFHNKYYFSLSDARNMMATCHGIRKKLSPFFKWVDFAQVEASLCGGWRNNGNWIDPNRVVLFFLYLDKVSFFTGTKSFTAWRITAKDIFLSMGCSKNREKLSGSWSVRPMNGSNHVQLTYAPGDIEKASVFYKHRLDHPEWQPPEYIPMRFSRKTKAIHLYGFDKCQSDFDYFAKLQNALRPTPFSFTDGVSQGVSSPLIDGVPKSEMAFVDMMKLLEDIENLERRDDLDGEDGADADGNAATILDGTIPDTNTNTGDVTQKEPL